jgi:hypothetical protein
MNSTIIVVNEEPYCIWEKDLKERNQEFINSIDGEYFEYLIKAHSPHIDEKDDKWAAVSLRLGYLHGLETLFSLIGAFLQAPDCAYAWISKCSTGDLRTLISRINKSDPAIFKKWKIQSVSWQAISDIVFSYYVPSTEKNLETRKQFANLWQRLSHDYLESNNIDEYNSLKHGFRIKPGGFGLQAGLEHTLGVSPPEGEMQTLGYSKHGTTFYTLERVGGDVKTNRSFRSRRVSINWEIERIILLLQLIAISIKNIAGILSVINGKKSTDVKFYTLADYSDFEKPWTFTSGVNNLKLDFVLEGVQPFTKEELMSMIKTQEDGKES